MNFSLDTTPDYHLMQAAVILSVALVSCIMWQKMGWLMRIVLIVAMPVLTSVLIATGDYFFDPVLPGNSYSAAFVLFIALFWTFLATPIGIVLGGVTKLITRCFSPRSRVLR